MPLIHDKRHRGRTQTGCLDSFHTFSFGSFRDPSRMGFRALRVLNEDRIIPGARFGQHSHANMDILSYVISGALRHQDSMGNASTIVPGEVQLMSAGSGVTHSEMNASQSDPVHFLQIWLLPDNIDGEPNYQQKPIDLHATKNALGLIAGPENCAAEIKLLSNSRVFLAKLDDEAIVNHGFSRQRFGFIHVISGQVEISGQLLRQGDALELEVQTQCTITLSAKSEAEVFLFTFD